MSDDSLLTGAKNIFINGINLNLESPEEEQHYMMHLAEHFEEESDFTAYLSKDGILEVETEGMQLGLQIHIIDSTLFMIPHVSDVFEIFTEVLRFISTHHQTVIRKFRGSEETKIESLKELNGLKDVEKNETEEPSSEDDYEWI